MTGTVPQDTGAQRRGAAGYLLPIAVVVVGTLLFVLFVSPGPLRPGGGGISAFGEDPGPLTAGAASVIGSHDQPGNVITYGHIILLNTGRALASLERVSFEPPLPENLTFLGIQVASDPDREIATVGAVDGYPPAGTDIGPLVPFTGAKVYPKDTVEGDRGAALIMGFRFEGGDVASFRYVHVDYRVGHRKYRAKLDQTLIVCSVITYPDDCPEQAELYPGE
jgi:hypothetical protein